MTHENEEKIQNEDSKISDLTNEVSSSLKSSSANKLLDRKPEESYIYEWTELVRKEKAKETVGEESSVVIFRLGEEWLALSTNIFAEVIRKRKIHSIPHRSNKIILGCVNYGGQLWLCASLHQLLETTDEDEKGEKKEHKGIYERMLAIQKMGERWILPVDEVFGVFHINTNNLENVPVTVKKSTANYIKGIFNWNQRNVSVLDDELLLYSLRRSLS